MIFYAFMNILVALTAFKESLSAVEACRAAAAGLRQSLPRAKIRIMPVSDGGDGLLEAAQVCLPPGAIRRIGVSTTGPLGAKIRADYLIWKIKKGLSAALIETARVCGLALVPPQSRNPLLTTTHGLGRVIQDALRRRVRLCYIGLGGSATVDAGCGLAQALGARFLDRYGKPIGQGNIWLGSLERVETGSLKKRLGKARFIALADVDNPLLGTRGAARVFGPQKGAAPEQVEAMEKNLARFARVVFGDNPRLGQSPFYGAAGGLAAGLAVFLGAEIVPGAETLLKLFKTEEAVREADWVIVGEGRLDGTTLSGKAPMAVARSAKSLGKKIGGLFGSEGPRAAEAADRLGLVFWRTAAQEAGSDEKSMKNPAFYLARAAQKTALLLRPRL